MSSRTFARRPLRSWLNLEVLEDRTTPTTVSMVKDVWDGGLGSNPHNLTDVNGKLFFIADDSDGDELWKSDDKGTVRLTNVNGPFGSNLGHLTNVEGTLYFTAPEAGGGVEIWKSDGTVNGTVAVTAFAEADPNLDHLTNVNGALYFTATTDNEGNELWKYDGNTAALVRDIVTGATGSEPQHLINFQNKLYFSANDGTGRELWTSDGTTAGTEQVAAIYPGVGSYPDRLTVCNGALYFIASDFDHGGELWITDGTAGGTKLAADIRVGDQSPGVSEMIAVNNTLFFDAFTVDAGRELWKFDGNTATLVKDINPLQAESWPSHLTNVNGTLFFSALQGNATDKYADGLWMSDGTSDGTKLVKNFRFGVEDTLLDQLTNVGGTLFFSADDNVNGPELWQSNGTADGTVLAKNIFPNPGGSRPQDLTNVNGTLFFRADDRVKGFELWKATAGGNGGGNDGSGNGGVVTLSFKDDALILTGDGHVDGNGVKITAITDAENKNKHFVLEGLGKTLLKTAFGEFASIDTSTLPAVAFPFENDGTDNLTVNFQGGNDTFIYDGFTNFNDGAGIGTDARKFGNVTLNMGAGDDTVKIKQATAKSLKITSTAPPVGGTDNDTIIIAAGGSLDLDSNIPGAERYLGGITTTTSDSLKLDLANGADNVLLALSSKGGADLKFNEADGDTLQIRGGSRIDGTTWVKMANVNQGVFNLTVDEQSRFGEYFNFSCNGHETLNANMANFTVGKSLSLQGGQGAASIFNVSNAQVSGGAGFHGGAGQDTFTLNNLTVAKGMTLNMSSGGSVGELKNSRIGVLDVPTATGNNCLRIENTTIQDAATIKNGIGDHSVTLYGVTVGKTLQVSSIGPATYELTNAWVVGDLKVTSDANDDKVTVSNSVVVGTATIDNKLGVNTVTVSALTVGKALQLSSNGNARYELKDSRILGDLKVTTQTRDDQVTISNSVVGGSATISDGFGADTLTLQGLNVAKDMTMTLSGGANTDVLKDSRIGGSLTVKSGDEVDGLSVQNTTIIGAVTIENGKGADHFDWTGSVGGNFTVNAGAYGNKGAGDPDLLQMDVGGNLSVTYAAGGSGETQLKVFSCKVGGTTTIKGAGPMDVNVSHSRFEKDFTYNSTFSARPDESGIDTVNLNRCSVYGATNITTASDNDVINLIYRGRPYKGKVTLATGGSSRIIGGQVVDHDEITINAAENVNEEITFLGGLKVDTGTSGADKITIGTTSGQVVVMKTLEYLGNKDDSITEGPSLIKPSGTGVTWGVRDDGALEIDGDDASNNVVVSRFVKNGADYYRVSVNGTAIRNNLGQLEVLQSDVTVKAVYFTGESGHDTFEDKSGTLEVHADGGEGDDTIWGSEFNDRLDGDWGYDKLYGRGGMDTIVGGPGDDYVEGGDHQDSINGGAGTDTLKGGAGTDFIWGDEDNDRIEGGSGNDFLYGGFDKDVLFGGAGDDQLNGEDGDDFLDGGGEANDFYNGGYGNDLAANQWAINGAFREDVKQNGIPSCWFLSALCSLADNIQTSAGNATSLADRIKYLGDGKYTVLLYNWSAKKWSEQVIEFTGAHSADVFPRANGDVNANAAGCEGEFWVTLFERAMLKLRATQQGRTLNYLDPAVVSREAGGFSDEGFQMVGVNATRVTAGTTGISDAQFTQLQNNYNSGQPIIADFNGGHAKLITGGHSYGFAEILSNLNQVKLYNPWGRDGAQLDGADDGYVTLTFEEFRRLCFRFALGQSKEVAVRPAGWPQ